MIEHPGTIKEIYFVLFDVNTKEVYQKEIGRIDYAKIEKALIQDENSDFIRLITLVYGKKEYRVCRETYHDIDSYIVVVVKLFCNTLFDKYLIESSFHRC